MQIQKQFKKLILQILIQLEQIINIKVQICISFPSNKKNYKEQKFFKLFTRNKKRYNQQ